MKTQKEYLENLFDQWKGDHWQMDDVIMIGARV
jgi:hypothetical protein